MSAILTQYPETLTELFEDLAEEDSIPALTEYFKEGEHNDDSLQH